MANGHHHWRMRDLAPGQVYDALSSLVVPRPIAFVSSLSREGVPNLAPFSFFMVGGVNPPSLVFCPVLGRDGAKKQTLHNIEATGEYVINLLTRGMAEGMNETGIEYPDGSDKWKLSGFTPAPSEEVRPARVAESPAQFECRLHQIVHHGSGSSSAVYVIGEVLRAHVAEELFDPETGMWRRFLPIARLGGADYLDLDGGKLFSMPRPKGPSASSVQE